MNSYYKYYLLLLFISLSIPYTFSQTHVQEASQYKTTATGTISQAFPAASTSGDLIIVHLDWGGSGSVNASGVTDSKGNLYHKISGSTTTWNAGAWKAELWYAYNIAGGGVITVSATFTNTPNPHSQIYISEYSSMLTSSDPFDKVSVGTGTTTGNISSGFQTTSFANELVYGVTIGANGTINAGAGFNTRSVVNANVVEDLFTNGTGSNDVHFTNTAAAGVNSWVAQMATFESNVSPLPIDLLYFTATPCNTNVCLNWATASETNNDYFTIEKSQDAVHYSFVNKQPGAGNSLSNREYNSLDANPFEGTSYYRLKQTDFNGAYKYSDVKQVNFEKTINTTFNAFPNPSDGSSINIVFGAYAQEQVEVDIYDFTGKRCFSKTIVAQSDGENTATIVPSQLLATGIYLINLRTEQGSFTQKVIVK